MKSNSTPILPATYVTLCRDKFGCVLLRSYLSTLDCLSILMAQFQGDRDSRGPADFSGAGGGKYDEDGDDNDDEDDEDSNRRTSKRKISKLGMQSDMGTSDVVSILFFSPRHTI